MTGLTFALFPVERYLARYANVIMTLAIAATTQEAAFCRMRVETLLKRMRVPFLQFSIAEAKAQKTATWHAFKLLDFKLP